MSSYTSPRMQLGLFGGEEPLPVAFDEPPPPAPPRREPREVSAERAARAAQRTIDGVALDPPDIEGWREELGHPRPQIVNGVCVTGEKWRRRVDGTLGPCPIFTCPRHLGLDVGEPITIGGRRHAELIASRAGEDPTMGRRPALPAVPTDGEADAFALHVIARNDFLPATCERDVIAQIRQQEPDIDEPDPEQLAARVDAVAVRVIAYHLGVSEEQVRLDTLSGAEKLGIRMVNGQPLPGYGDHAEQLLARISGRRLPPTDAEVAASVAGARALLTDTAPPPVVIRRIEREAPPPRELTVDEIFGEGW